MDTEFKKVLFIVNKFAGTGYEPRIEGCILDTCQKKGAECRIEFTAGKGHATELASQADGQYSAVVAVGGDGTLNEVARGLLFSGTPMGIVPRGSGNGLARHLHIPLTFSKAVEALFHSRAVPADTFTVNGNLSLNISGIGFDGHIANLFGKNGKRGLFNYARLTIQQYIRFKEFKAVVTTNGNTVEKNVFVIAIANSSQYGNNARIAPVASICDQILHANLLTKVPPYRLDFVYSFFTGTAHRSAFCQIIETRAMHVKTSRPVAFHVDGEPLGEETSFDIKILPASLQLLAPETASGKCI